MGEKIYYISKRGVENMTVLDPVKPIRPTVVNDEETIKQVIKEAYTKPTENAIKTNKNALELLKMLKG